MPHIALLFMTALGLLACTPKQATHASSAKRAAAADFGCEVSEVQIREQAVGVFLMEGCGELASFYCAEGGSLDMRCRRVSDPAELEGDTLVDVIAGYDKRKDEGRRRDPAVGDSASSAAKASSPPLEPQPSATAAEPSP